MAAKNEKLLDRFLEDRQRGYDYRQHFEPQWRKNWQGYMNKRPRPHIPNEYWSHSRTRVADEFRVIETILPQHMLGMYRSRNWFSVQAASGPGRLYETIVKQLLLIGWKRADMFRKTIEGTKYGLICGHAIMKNFWDVKVGPKEVLSLPDGGLGFDGDTIPQNLIRQTREDIVFNGPQSYFPDLFDVIQDPTGRDMWFMERIPMSLEQLEYENSQYKGALYNTSAINKLKEKINGRSRRRPSGSAYPGGPPMSGWITSAINTQDNVAYVEGIEEQRQVDDVDVWQWWTWVPPSVRTYDDTQWRLILVVNDEQIIRDVAAPTPDRRHPYSNIKAIPIPGRIYGESPLYWVGDLADLRNFIEDARREEVLQKLWQPMIVDEQSSLSPDDLFRRPGGMLWVGNHTGNLKDSIIPVQQSDVMPSAYNESAIKEDQIHRTSGATDPFQGVAAGGRTTATEASIVAQLGSGRFQLATMWFDETMKLPALKNMFRLYQSRLQTKEIVELVGNPRERYEIGFDDLLWDVDIHVDTGAFGSLDSQLLQSYLQLYSIFAANPQAAQYLNHGEVIRDAFIRAGDWRADDHVRTEDQVARMAQAAAAEQQQLAQQQLQGQQSIDSNRELARGFAQALGSGGGGEGEGSSLVESLG